MMVKTATKGWVMVFLLVECDGPSLIIIIFWISHLHYQRRTYMFLACPVWSGLPDQVALPTADTVRDQSPSKQEELKNR